MNAAKTQTTSSSSAIVNQCEKRPTGGENSRASSSTQRSVKNAHTVVGHSKTTERAQRICNDRTQLETAVNHAQRKGVVKIDKVCHQVIPRHTVVQQSFPPKISKLKHSVVSMESQSHVPVKVCDAHPPAAESASKPATRRSVRVSKPSASKESAVKREVKSRDYRSALVKANSLSDEDLHKAHEGHHSDLHVAAAKALASLSVEQRQKVKSMDFGTCAGRDAAYRLCLRRIRKIRKSKPVKSSVETE